MGNRDWWPEAIALMESGVSITETGRRLGKTRGAVSWVNQVMRGTYYREREKPTVSAVVRGAVRGCPTTVWADSEDEARALLHAMGGLAWRA